MATKKIKINTVKPISEGGRLTERKEPTPIQVAYICIEFRTGIIQSSGYKSMKEIESVTVGSYIYINDHRFVIETISLNSNIGVFTIHVTEEDEELPIF